MGLQSVRQKAPTTYYGYTEPDTPKENYSRIKVDEFVEGFYFQSYEREGQFGKQWNHVLIKEDGTHHVIPGSKDVDRDFLDNAKEGLFTRYTYLGKKTFDFVKEDGSTGKAKAIQGLIQQDPDRTCTFEGDKFSAKVVTAQSTQDQPTTDSAINADDIPF